MSNEALQRAHDNRNDEFYTRYEDIEKEVSIYRDHFANKSVYLPCDGETSEFWRYFVDHFDDLNLKSVARSSYNKDGRGRMEIFDGKVTIEGDLFDDGSLDGSSVALHIQRSDIVVTNPPFSRFRDFMAVALNSGKEFLVVGPIHATTYRDIFPYIRDRVIWPGVTKVSQFNTPTGETRRMGNVIWYTNIDHAYRHIPVVAKKTYQGHEREYPVYDNYYGIEVSSWTNLPNDYDGIMGVPVTAISKITPEQFDIIDKRRDLYLYGVQKFERLLIKWRKTHE